MLVLEFSHRYFEFDPDLPLGRCSVVAIIAVVRGSFAGMAQWIAVIVKVSRSPSQLFYLSQQLRWILPSVKKRKGTHPPVSSKRKAALPGGM